MPRLAPEQQYQVGIIYERVCMCVCVCVCMIAGLYISTSSIKVIANYEGKGREGEMRWCLVNVE